MSRVKDTMIVMGGNEIELQCKVGTCPVLLQKTVVEAKMTCFNTGCVAAATRVAHTIKNRVTGSKIALVACDKATCRESIVHRVIELLSDKTK